MRQLWLGVVATTMAFALAAGAAHANVDLLTQGNIRIDGGAAGDRLGGAVASAGDVNHDGRPDIIVGANRANNNASTRSGSAYVLYGSATPTSIDLSTLTVAQGFRIDGSQGSEAGSAVAAVGDVNDDGFDDVAVGAVNDGTARPNAGAVYVIYGAATHATVDLSALTPTQGFRIDGAAENDTLGQPIARAGDVNGDGRDDLILSAGSHNGGAGEVFVIYGATTHANLDLATLTPSEGFAIEGADLDTAGSAVAGAGDINGDHFGDVVIGAFGASIDGRDTAGAAYVIYGAATRGTIELASLTASQGYVIAGAAAGDEAGSAVAAPGDVNGDGRADLVVGASQAGNNGRAASGSVYVIYGTATQAPVDLATLTSAQGFRIDGAAAGDQLGVSAAGLGDLNGDGRADLLVGASGAGNNARTASGSAYLIYGGASAGPVDLAGLTTTRGFRIDGAAAGDQLGGAVAGAGDIDGDGRADLLIGARLASNNSRASSGSAYLVLSSSFPPPKLSYPSLSFGGFGQATSIAPTDFEPSGPATFAASPALPAGLTIDPATGTISGTATAAGIASYAITVTDANGHATATLVIAIVNAQGAAGASGPPGANGSAGAAGPAGTSLTKIAFVVFAISPATAVKSGRSVAVRYAITDPATLTLSVKAKGKKAVKVATKKAARAGVGSIAWNGKLSGKKARAGSYTLTITAARDGQTVSSTVTVKVSR